MPYRRRALFFPVVQVVAQGLHAAIQLSGGVGQIGQLRGHGGGILLGEVLLIAQLVLQRCLLYTSRCV